MYSILNCHNVAKHAEFYLAWLRFHVSSTGNAGCLQKNVCSCIRNVTYVASRKVASSISDEFNEFFS
jgi:hypothetical protein